jgi:SagB-type dehydrogenase family enzyme
MTAPRYRRHPFVRVRLGDPIECDLLLDGRTFQLPSPAAAGALAVMTGGRSREEFEQLAGKALGSHEHASALVGAFIAADLLVPADRTFEEMPAVRHWMDRGWLDALIFHLRARAIPFDDDRADDPGALHDEALRPFVADATRPPHLGDGPRINLPPPIPRIELPPLGETMLQRRSNRPWSGRVVTTTDVATILGHATAETEALRARVATEAADAPRALLNSAFSALDISVLIFAVDGLEPGLYRYDSAAHQLVLRRRGDLRAEAASMCAGQPRAGSGALLTVITADWRRYMVRYQSSHAYRVLMVNGGELGQKLLLLATARGLSTFITPAFREAEAEDLLGLTADDGAAIEAIGVG